jgi:hypothetical protein
MDIAEFVTLTREEESLKIEKNSKGYNWEFKLIGKIDNDLMDKAEQINNNLKSKFQKEVN